MKSLNRIKLCGAVLLIAVLMSGASASDRVKTANGVVSGVG
jgi:hypothetical protein